MPEEAEAGIIIDDMPVEAPFLHKLDEGVSVKDVDDDFYDHVLNNSKEIFGFEFDGDKEMAKFYLDEIVSGVVFPFEESGKSKLLKHVRLGFSIDSRSGMASTNVDDYWVGGRWEPQIYVSVNLKELARMSRYQPEVEWDSEYSGGPTWYVARELGVEEGAHALYFLRRGAIEPVVDHNLGSDHYHSNDTEFDGLYWRIVDTELLLDDPAIEGEERLAINRRLMLMKRTLQNSHRLRAYRQDSPALIDKHKQVRRILARPI